MITVENISIIIQIATLIGLIFAVYLYFRTPQEKSEINDKIFEEKMNTMRADFANLRDNHIHTLTVKLDDHIRKQGETELKTAENFARLFTLIEERFPKK